MRQAIQVCGRHALPLDEDYHLRPLFIPGDDNGRLLASLINTIVRQAT
jgi:hypothetical protein